MGAGAGEGAEADDGGERRGEAGQAAGPAPAGVGVQLHDEWSSLSWRSPGRPVHGIMRGLGSRARPGRRLLTGGATVGGEGVGGDR
ncbi:hypothetical protein GCM10018789_21790 [Streptomyces werraensis]|nr:hypothetical protein GCM10018789_21790 [Streptomyces werraensis]